MGLLRLPAELVHRVFDDIASEAPASLPACRLVCKSLLPFGDACLFASLRITAGQDSYAGKLRLARERPDLHALVSSIHIEDNIPENKRVTGELVELLGAVAPSGEMVQGWAILRDTALRELLVPLVSHRRPNRKLKLCCHDCRSMGVLAKLEHSLTLDKACSLNVTPLWHLTKLHVVLGSLTDFPSIIPTLNKHAQGLEEFRFDIRNECSSLVDVAALLRLIESPHMIRFTLRVLHDAQSSRVHIRLPDIRLMVETVCHLRCKSLRVIEIMDMAGSHHLRSEGLVSALSALSCAPSRTTRNYSNPYAPKFPAQAGSRTIEEDDYDLSSLVARWATPSRGRVVLELDRCVIMDSHKPTLRVALTWQALFNTTNVVSS